MIKYTNLNYISANANLNAKYLTSSHFNFYLTKNSYIRSDNPREREFFTTPQITNMFWPLKPNGPFTGAILLRRPLNISSDRKSRIGVRYRNNVYRNDRSVATRKQY